MIQTITELLLIIKKHKVSGRYIDIALGKNKYPESMKEAYNQFKKELWRK